MAELMCFLLVILKNNQQSAPDVSYHHKKVDESLLIL